MDETPGVRKIGGVIFDLDDTLFDCTGQLTGPARRRAAEEMAGALSSLSVGEICSLQADLSAAFGSSGAIREIGRQHPLPPHIVEGALRAYNREAVESISPFPDVPEALAELRKRGYRLSLVTTGRPDRQRRKVRLLGLGRHFDEARGTLLLHDDRQDPLKDASLRRAADRLDLPAHRILSVGDKLDAEIAASNRLGMATARLRHGRQKDRLPRTPEERPHYEIDRISDLLTILPSQES